MSRHLFRATLAAVAIIAFSGPGFAQMDKLEIVAPGGPGSGQDQVARAVAEAMQKEGIVANRAGGQHRRRRRHGRLRAVHLARRRATAMPCSRRAPATSSSRSPTRPEVSMNDVTPLALLAGEWEVLVTKSDSGIDSISRPYGEVQGRSGLGDVGAADRRARPTTSSWRT